MWLGSVTEKTTCYRHSHVTWIIFLFVKTQNTSKHVCPPSLWFLPLIALISTENAQIPHAWYFWYICDFSNRLVSAELNFTGGCCGIFPGLNWCAFCALMSIYCVCGIDCTACMCVVMTKVSPCAIVWLSDVFLIVCAKQWMFCGKNKRSLAFKIAFPFVGSVVWSFCEVC